MKKFLTLSLGALLVVSALTGCGCAKEDAAPQTTTVAPAEDAQATDTPAAEGGITEEAPQNNTAGGVDDSSVTAEVSSAPAPAPELPAVSENKEVVTKDAAPKVFLLKGATGTDSLTYHLENCKKLEGNEKQEASWEMISMVGYWQCPECNPPRYEDYKNAE